MRYPVEEYRLFYESAEKVTERRLAANRFNYSICTALLLAVVYMVNWSRTNLQYSYLGLLFACLLSALATVFCYYWLKQINDFKQLNNAKFQVLQQMAPRVWFGPACPENLSSAEPFKEEWRIMEENQELILLRTGKLTVLGSSNAELFIPKAFIFCFVALFIVSLVPIAFHFGEFWDGMRSVVNLWSPVYMQR